MSAGTYQPIRLWDIEAIREAAYAYVESASLAAVYGAPCIVDSAGRLAEAGTSFKQAAVILNATGSNASSAGATIEAYPIRADQTFEVTLNEAWALNLTEKSFGLVKDATTKNWYLSTANTGNQMWIVAPHAATNVGDTKSRVLARFNASAIQGAGSALNSLIPGVGADLASATTITPTNAVHHVTGTTAVATITVPAGLPDGFVLSIIPEGVFATTTAGNIGLVSSATVVKRTLTMTWDASLAKWFPSYVS